MPEHTTQFTVFGDVEKIYDLAVQYFIGHGFSLQNEQRPNQLVFKKSGTRFTFDIRKAPQKLYINFIQEEGGKVKVTFLFNITVSGVFTPSDIPKLESDVMAFKNLILSTIPQQPSQPRTENEKLTCPKCGKAISSDFAFCPYCGTKLKEIKHKCPKCGKEVSPEFKVCPYCGTTL